MSSSEANICPQCREKVPADYVVCPYCGYSLVKIVRARVRARITLFESIGRIFRFYRRPHESQLLMQQIANNADRKGPIIILSAVWKRRLGASSHPIRINSPGTLWHHNSPCDTPSSLHWLCVTSVACYDLRLLVCSKTPWGKRYAG
jgi:hypothetical protein